MIVKVITIMRKFGLIYTFFYVIQKCGIIHELPVFLLLKRQKYFKSLPLEDQKRELCFFYKNATGRDLNIENPATFTEKIQWMKFYDSRKEKADLSDKYLAPKLIQKNYENKLRIIPQLGMWSRGEDIDFESLPDKFVLKCNHGSAMNIIVKDKSKLNKKKTIIQLNNWLKIDYAYVNGMYENHYSFIDRKIIAEQFVEEMDGNLHDYKFHCFMGEPKIIEFIGDRISNTHTIHSSIYTSEWKKLPISFNDDTPYEEDFTRPKKLDDMISLARCMSKAYFYVRVDFYYINDVIYFGELTFTPDSGIIRFNDSRVDDEWGKWISLPILR